VQLLISSFFVHDREIEWVGGGSSGAYSRLYHRATFKIVDAYRILKTRKNPKHRSSKRRKSRKSREN